MTVVLKPLLRPAYDVYRRTTATARRLPDFLVIGAQKAGTTSFFANILEHPEVRAPRGKEVHFFSRRFEDGVNGYRSYFPFRFLPAVTGEASPDYIVYPEVPARVKAVLPNVKIIALLREPVSRAYSHFQMTRRRGHEDLSFLDALEAESGRLAEGRKWGGDFGWRNFSYAARGRYAEQLRPWFETFDRAQLLVLRSEDFYAAPEDCLAEVTGGFLGLAPWRPTIYRKANTNKWSYPPLKDSERRAAAAHFEADGEELAALLGGDFAGW